MLRTRGLAVNKLGARLLLLILLAAVPVLAVQIYHEVQQRAQRRAEVGAQVQQMAELVAGQLDRTIEGAETLMATLGEVPAVRFRSRDACQQALVRLAARFAHLHLIRAASPDGEVFCSSSPADQLINIAGRPYFQRALQDRAPAVSALSRREPDGRKVIAIAQPTLDEDAEIETVLVLLLEPGGISDLLAQVPLPDGTVLGVLDRRGRLAARVPYLPERIGEPMADPAQLPGLLGPDRGSVAREGDDAGAV